MPIIIIDKLLAIDLYKEVNNEYPLGTFKNLSQSYRKIFITVMQVLQNGEERQVKSSSNIKKIKRKCRIEKQKHCYSFISCMPKAIANLFGRISSKSLLDAYNKASNNQKSISISNSSFGSDIPGDMVFPASNPSKNDIELLKKIKIRLGFDCNDEDQKKFFQKEVRKIRESNYIPDRYKSRGNLRLFLPALVVQADMPEEHVFCRNDFKYKEAVLKKECKHPAHGVEDMKGGRVNLLNIMIEGIVQADYTGPLENGSSCWFAGPHGPYYLIFDKEAMRDHIEEYANKIFYESCIMVYLVPDEKSRLFYVKGLKKALEMRYITEEEMNRVLGKLITYEEFIGMTKKSMSDTKEFKNEVQQIIAGNLT